MADHVLSPRTPDEILADFDRGSSERRLLLERQDRESRQGPGGQTPQVSPLTADERAELNAPPVDMRAVMWEIIDAVRDSYALALRGVGRMGATLTTGLGSVRKADRGPEPVPISPLSHLLEAWEIAEIEQTVEDFLVNNFGDD